MYTVIFSWKLNQSDKNVTIYYKNVYMRCASDYSDPVSPWLCIFRRKSAILYFWPTPNPLYYTSDLLARGFHLKLDIHGRSARPQSLS